ncbi:MAG: radical SAM protein [Nitrospinae bacterium]|nr:radical SAM protein [Nitrospinota bacterium]
MPKMLSIDPTNHCNLRCPLCPTGLDDPNVERGLMKLEQYKSVIDRLGKWLQSANLYSWGEPLLNKSFVDMLRYTSRDPFHIRAISSANLNILSAAQIEGLVASGLDKLIVSCDGVSQEVYEKYRVGGKVETVFENMKKLAAEKKRANSPIRIVWNYLVMKHNEHEIDLAKKIAGEIGVEITFGLMRTNLKDDILQPASANIQRDLEWIPESPEFNPYNVERKTRKKPLSFCKRPWQETFVNWNGDVFPCGCVVTEKKYSMGNVFEKDFMEIWNGERYVSARKELLGKPNDIETVCHVCKRNGYYTP